jgi:DNA mismatch repair ATPase MutS
LNLLNKNTAVLESYNRGWLAFETLFNSITPASLSYTIYKSAQDPKYGSSYGFIKAAIKEAYRVIKSPYSPTPLKAVVAIYPPFLLYGTINGFYQLIGTQKNNNEGICHLQDILVGTGNHIKALEQLSNYVRKNKHLLQLTPSLQPLADFNDKTKRSASLNKLISMLNTNTFEGQPSFWSISGRVLAAHKLMQEIKNELIPVIVASAELEMLCTVANIYTSSKDNNTHFCMVDFIENSTTPVIDAQNFWNPFISPDKVVANSINFDSTCPNSILTGPNTGGKSTVIKTLMINCLLAQTFGIAAADQFALTPFAKLNCFMNISDDIATGASLFKSEVMRAKKLLTLVQELKENEFSFVIIDEVFTGTSPKEGEEAACAFAKKLGSYTNNIAIIATHYPKMTDLENETNGLFKNHHIEILQNEDGSLNRTFKLKTGPSFFNVASNIIEEEGLFI